jgi:hypothetical protein
MGFDQRDRKPASESDEDRDHRDCGEERRYGVRRCQRSEEVVVHIVYIDMRAPIV